MRIDIEARKTWLREMASLFEDAAMSFGSKSLETEHLDNFIDAWIQDAAFFKRQFLNRIELYEFPFIKDASSDAELRKNAQIAEMILKKVESIEPAESEAAYATAAHRCELEYIMAMTEPAAERED